LKKTEVPQDHLAFYGRERRALYAVDESGHYTTAESSGWQVEEVVNGLAVAEYERLAQEALERARAGQAAPMEYHMYARRLDVTALAQAAGLWQWRVRRHLKPAVFAKLSPALLQRYADALGVAVETLRTLPERPG
jgi:hypothetical protein